MRRHPSLDDRFDPAIRLVAYDRDWPAAAGAELRRIAGALSRHVVALEHVGSTAVPGLAAKPILDLQVSVEAIVPVEVFVEPLRKLGYLYVPAPEYPTYPLFARPAERPRSHHLHLCQAGSDEELRHLAVRDFLREFPNEVNRYAAFKSDLAAEHPEDRLAYIEGKAGYVNALEKRALDWRRLD